MENSALLIFSGGQDSATCLAWALDNFAKVTTLGFDYGQRHVIEMTCRGAVRQHIAALNYQWQQRLGEDIVLKTDFFQQICETALTANLPIQALSRHETHAIPNTFVPGRNLLFLNMAAAWAYDKHMRHIVMGVCEADTSGYPDCRDDSIKAMQVALNSGMNTNYVIHTPLMWRTKAHTWSLAEKLGGSALVDVIREYSHTCYTGDRTRFYEWGYGCASCPACMLRARGYAEYTKANSLLKQEHL